MRLPVAFGLSLFEVHKIMPSYAAARDAMCPYGTQDTRCSSNDETMLPDGYPTLGAHMVAPAHNVKEHDQVLRKDRCWIS